MSDEQRPQVPPRQKGRRPGQRGAPVGKVANPRRVQETRAAHRRRQMWWAGGAVAVVVAVVVVVVAVGLSSGSAKPAPRVALTSAEVTPLTHVPLPTLVQASAQVGHQLQPAQTIDPPPKPDLLYIGAEFCPVCATQRWAMVVALSHFGTFTDLSQTRSAPTDGNIGTFSFYGSSFTSPYLTFSPVENTTNVRQGDSWEPLQTPTAAQQALWTKYDGQSLSYPFIYIGGRYLLGTSQMSPDLLIGKSFSDIASQVGNNTSTIGVNIDAAAAAFAKYVCGITDNKPAAVCDALAGVTAPVTSGSSTGPSSSSGG